MSTYVVKDLEQARLLTDPFKLKLIEKFAEGPITTKQVADALGEKAPRLYRHVEALAEAGFLELVSEKQKRGTIERYFKTVATRFELDPGLFSVSETSAGETQTMLRGLFLETLDELSEALGRYGIAAKDNPDAGVAMRLRVRANKEDIADLRRRLKDWIDSVGSLAEDDPKDGADEEEWAGLIVLYPTDVDWPTE